jgi:crossover junction endodeoxyribonuclease RuvC
VAEYPPAEVKRAIVGYGRAEKTQVQRMVQLLLGLDEITGPLDATDALAVAICHVHSLRPAGMVPEPDPPAARQPRSWRQFKVEGMGDVGR